VTALANAGLNQQTVKQLVGMAAQVFSNSPLEAIAAELCDEVGKKTD